MLKILKNIDYCDETIRRSRYLNAAWKERWHSKKDILPYSDGNYVAYVTFADCKKYIPIEVLQSLHVFDLLAGFTFSGMEINLNDIHFSAMEFLKVFSLKKSKIKQNEILFNLDKLRQLGITKSDFPFSGLEDLKQALPNTKIFYSEYDYFQWKRKNE